MGLARNLLFSLRSLSKQPGFALLVVFTLALGIGANTAVFSLVYAVLLRPLPYPQPDRLVALYESSVPNDLSRADYASPANFLDWQTQNRAFTAIGASCGFNYNLTGSGTPEHLSGAAVSASYFSVLGIQPVVGRTFAEEDDHHNAANVVVLSERLWRRRFQADPQIFGKTVSINGDGYTVLGVMPAFGPLPGDDELDLWVPLQRQILPQRMQWRNMRFLRVLGRLRPGVTLEQARAEMNGISASIKQSNQAADVYAGVVVLPLHEAMVRGDRHNLLLSLGIVGIVLLIACANVATLMLVRIAARTRELAIRMALGATRARVMAELLAECILIGLAAGVLGLAIAIAAKRVLLALVPWRAAQFGVAELNLAVLGFTFVVSLATAIVFGLAPVLAARSADLQEVLRRTGRAASAGLQGRYSRNAFVVCQIALSVVLLVGTGLLVRSLLALERAPLGFRPEHLVTIRVPLPRIKYQQDSDVIAFFDRLGEKARALPGVEEASLANVIPLIASNFSTRFSPSGRGAAEGEYHAPRLRLVDAHYFSMLSIPVLRGRNFTDHDRTDSQPVAIISATLARRYWPNQDPIGQHLVTIRDAATAQISREIVGVVGDVRDNIDEEPQPTIYVPYPQMSFPTMRLLLRTQAPLGTLVAGVQRAMQSIDPDQPIYGVATFDAVVAESLQPWKFALAMLGGLAALALALTAIGLFAVISYLVRQRTRELGIRIAIGAPPARVLKMVVMQGLSLTAGGLALGAAGALAATRFMSSLIYGVHPNDPLTLSAAALLLAVVALIASYVPARRAAQVDPLVALREE